MNWIGNSFWDRTIIFGKSFAQPHDLAQAKDLNRLAQVMHLFLFFIAISVFSPYSQMPDFQDLLNSEKYFLPLWCTGYLSYFDWDNVVYFICNGLLFTAFLNLLFWRRSFLVRLLFFLFFFHYVALISSFGKVDHYLHVAVFSSFTLVFVPFVGENDSKVKLARGLVLIFGLQVLIALAYFTSGIFKCYGILDQVLNAQVSTLDGSALGRNIAKTEIANGFPSFYADLVYKTPSFLWSLVLMVGYAVEFLSIYAVFKPQLHRLWGLLLVFLHAGILLTVGPEFTYQMFLVGCLFILSPFQNSAAFNLKSFWNSYFCLTLSKQKPSEIIIYFDDHCLMCNRFISRLSRYNLPDELKLSGQSGAHYQAFMTQYPDMQHLDAIVVEVKDPDSIKIKSAAVLQVLAHVSWKYRLLLPFYRFSPFLSDLIYDFIARRRKKSLEVCAIPSAEIRGRLVG